MANDGSREEEDRRIHQLRFIVDFACSVISRQKITLEESIRLIEGVKKIALQLFPDKESTFDLIYGSRFRRILLERFPLC
jgi:hypothetical protein